MVKKIGLAERVDKVGFLEWEEEGKEKGITKESVVNRPAESEGHLDNVLFKRCALRFLHSPHEKDLRFLSLDTISKRHCASCRSNYVI